MVRMRSPVQSRSVAPHGGVAQLVRAHGSYPWCPGFKSLRRYHYQKMKRLLNAFSSLFMCARHGRWLGTFWYRLPKLLSYFSGHKGPVAGAVSLSRRKTGAGPIGACRRKNFTPEDYKKRLPEVLKRKVYVALKHRSECLIRRKPQNSFGAYGRRRPTGDSGLRLNSLYGSWPTGCPPPSNAASMRLPGLWPHPAFKSPSVAANRKRLWQPPV